MNNTKKYKEVEFDCGESIDEAMEKLSECKVPSYGVFNGQTLYSDSDTIDTAYVKITGKTKTEFDAKQEQDQTDRKEQERKHKEAIPELTKKWIAEGHRVLTEDKWKDWDKCVPIRLGDLYQGMELQCCLNIIEVLKESDNDFEKGRRLFYDQGHSGMSHGLVCSMLISFYDKGKDFVEYVK